MAVVGKFAVVVALDLGEEDADGAGVDGWRSQPLTRAASRMKPMEKIHGRALVWVMSGVYSGLNNATVYG